MKKATAIILAVIMALLLISCSGTQSPSSPSGESPTSSAPPPASPTDSAPPDTPANTDTPAASGTIGYLTDEADHWNRDPFKIGYICVSMGAPFTKAISDCIEKFGEALNYEYYAYDANHDYDGYINQLISFAEQGYDGLILGTDTAITMRAYELAREYEIAFVAESTAFLDDAGKCIWPSVAQDQYANGQACMEWLIDNYKNYWGDIDASTVGCISLTFTPVSGIHEREPGVHDAFVKAFPEAAGNYFVGDLVTTPSGFSVAGGEEVTSAIVPANPQVEHWFIVGLVDDYSLGATRAVERLGKGDITLIASVQADSFIADLESGSSGDIYVAACAISPAEFGGYMASNLVAILEGRATAETIWPEWVVSPGEYAYIRLVGTMITKDTYKDWQKETSLETLFAAIPK